MLGSTVIVQTEMGPVRGLCQQSFVGEKFYRFRGIPYAKPPIGDLRFKVSKKKNPSVDWSSHFCYIKDPQPIDAWTIPVDATSQGPTAMARSYITSGLNIGCSEDCLTLNVYTKQVSEL